MDPMRGVVVLPVADVDRSKAFYEGLGFRLDADITSGDDVRVVQLTPVGARTSIIFGCGVTAAEPGSLRGAVLAVADIGAACADLASSGIHVSSISPAPDRSVGGLCAAFEDPDGNGWILHQARQAPPDGDAGRRGKKWRWIGPSSTWLSRAMASMSEVVCTSVSPNAS